MSQLITYRGVIDLFLDTPHIYDDIRFLIPSYIYMRRATPLESVADNNTYLPFYLWLYNTCDLFLSRVIK